MLTFLLKMNWSDTQTSNFIEMYRDRSYLWDSSDVNYKNRNKRHDGLEAAAPASSSSLIITLYMKITH